MTQADELRDAQRFPLELDAPAEAFTLGRVALDSLGRASFLDQRFDLAATGAERVAANAVLDALAGDAPRPAFVFHTAFCCSTLLARALHAPPAVVALKEPNILLQLQMDAIGPRAGEARVQRLVEATLRLLARPWVDGGRVLIKPTNVVNGLMPRFLATAPRSRAVLLYSSLREFLISCVKKLPDAETKTRWMAQHLLHGSALARRLGVTPNHPFHFVESCVLTWYSQLERYADALDDDAADRLRTLDMEALLAAPAEAVRACADWLDLPAAHEGLDARVTAEFSRHAKAIDRAYDADARAREKALVLQRYAPLIDQAEAWAAEAVQPAARLPRHWKPLLA